MMAKVISQETFDSVVRENMVDFEMEVDEAIEDAIIQFESQGVNLLNIIRDPNLYAGGADAPTKHAVIAALDALIINLAAISLDENDVKTNLDKLKAECDKDLARRIMAGKNNAHGLLIAACLKSESRRDLMKEILAAWVSLCTGQPDLLNNAGMDLLLGYVKHYDEAHDPEMVTLAVLLIRTTCIMHEQNRQNYVESGLIRLLVKTLDNNRDKQEVVKEVCGTLRVLTNDDDPRAPFGKAHEHAKMIVTEENALRKIMNIAHDYKTNGDVLGELFLTLARLSVRNEFCAEIMDLGGIELILETLANNITNKSLVRQIMVIIKTVAGNDDVKIAVVRANGAELILAAMDQHQRAPRVAEYACATVATIVLRNEDNCRRVMAVHGAESIVKVMQLHPKDENVQKQGCMAVRNLVARTREHCPSFLEAGAETMIKHALTSYPSCKDEATAALRDLGCDVHLRELWKGEGVSLAQDY